MESENRELERSSRPDVAISKGERMKETKEKKKRLGIFFSTGEVMTDKLKM